MVPRSPSVIQGLNILKTMNGSYRYEAISEMARMMEITLEVLMGDDAIIEYDAWDG